MSKPSFFIIGAPKCGTTSLAAWLATHPEVFVSPVKEPHFFNTDDDEPHRPTAEEYDLLFAAAGDHHKAVGEASVWYLYSEVAVPNILAYQPEAKFVICLRNPVEMAYSLHKQKLFSGTENLADFGDAWRAQEDRARGLRRPPLGEPRRLQYGPICSLGCQLERLYRRVDQDRVHILFLDDLRRDPDSAYAGVLRFLGLSEGHSPEFRVHNPTQERRHPWLRQLSMRAGRLKRALGIRRGLGLLDRVNEWNTRESGWKADPAMVLQLKEYFSADIDLLSKLTGRDLSSWTSSRSDGRAAAAARETMAIGRS